MTYQERATSRKHCFFQLREKMQKIFCRENKIITTKFHQVLFGVWYIVNKRRNIVLVRFSLYKIQKNLLSLPT